MRVLQINSTEVAFPRYWKSKFPEQETLDLNVALYDVKYWNKRVSIQACGYTITIWKDRNFVCFKSGRKAFAIIDYSLGRTIDTHPRHLEKLMHLFTREFKVKEPATV